MTDPATHGIPQPSQAVLVLGKAQKGQPPINLSRVAIKRFHAEIPDENSWGRPMPLKRVRNAKKVAYKKLIDRLLPPLPLEEWERLRDLATGKLKVEIPKRRSANDKGTDKLSHELTPRFMRRMWGRVFIQCPAMAGSHADGKWKVQWGALKPELAQGHQDADSFLFADCSDDDTP